MESGYWTRHEQDLYAQRMEDEHKRVNKRVEVLEKNYEQLTELTMCVREQTMTINNMAQEVQRQGEQLGQITSEPARQWGRAKDKAIDAVVGMVIGGLMGLVLSAIAMSL